MRSLVAPTAAMGFSNLFLDFLAERPSARSLFPFGGIDETAHRLDLAAFDRATVADMLEAQNRALGAGQATLANIASLRGDSNALCVLTGQQAVVLGGPLLVVYKAIGAIKSAQFHSERLGRPVVPVFWIAGDDHDFAEVNHTWLLDRQTQPVRIEYATTPKVELPVGELHLSDTAALEQTLVRLRECLGETDFTGDVYALVERCYTPGDTFVSAFGRLLTALLGEHGLVLFSPTDGEAKRRAAPLFRAIVERQDEVHALLAATNTRLLESGYHLQVAKSSDSVHLFYNRDGRRPIKRDGYGFVVGDLRLSQDDLLARMEAEPERFSPDVLTRPLMQSLLFPTLIQSGGPAEIAYLAQMAGLFELFDLTPPVHRPRPSASIVERRFASVMRQHDIAFADLSGDIEQVINRVMARDFPSALGADLGRLRDDIRDRVDRFAEAALTFDPGLKAVAEQTAGKIDFALKAFEGKAFAAHKRRSQETRDQIYRLHNVLFPGRAMQERQLNVLFFVARYGLSFVHYLHEQLDSEEKSHQVITLDDYGTA